MEEIGDPMERLKESMEAAEEKREKWTLSVALSTAIIAVFAAIAGMLGNHHANEAVLEQIKAADRWAYYQSKSIKSEVAGSTTQIMSALNKPLPADNAQKLAKYEQDKAAIRADAEQAEKSSEDHMRRHIVFSRAVTIYQVAIAICAVAILARKRWLWYLSLLLAAAGCIFFAMGFSILSR